MQPILEAKNLLKNFPLNRGILERKKAQVHAVRSVSLKVNKGETFGIVGESLGVGRERVRRIKATQICAQYQAIRMCTVTQRLAGNGSFDMGIKP